MSGRNRNLSVSIVGPADENSNTAFVVIKIDEVEYTFRRDCGAKPERVAVVAHLQREFADQVGRVREVEYERGYRHGRARKAKNPTSASTLYVTDWMLR